MPMNRGILGAACAGLCALAACGSGGTSSAIDGAVDGAVDLATTGMCGADIPPGQACNALVAAGPSVTPTCTTGTMPTGEGGTILDGTYVLTAQTYYSVTTCPTIPLVETIQIAGGCVQVASSAPFPVTGSTTFAAAGNSITLTQKCIHTDIDGATITPDAPTETFTATATTFALYTQNAAVGNPNRDRVEVFTKQ
jgi:hypothetical protein